MKRIMALVLAFSVLLTLSVETFASTTKNPPQGSIITPEIEKSFGPTLGFEGGSDELAPDKNSVRPRAVYSLENVYTTIMDLYEPLTDYMYNDFLEESGTWPEISCERGDGLTVSAELNNSVDLSAEFVSRQLGFTVGGSYSVTASQSYTYKVPYGQGVRIVIRWKQKYAEYDIYIGSQSVGSGDAMGKPYDKRVTVQRVYLW